MKCYQLVSLLFVVALAQAAKLDNVQARQSNTGTSFFQGGSDASSLFGSLGSYLPPVENKCVDKTITSTYTYTQPPTTVTQRGPGPRTVVQTDVSYVTQPASTVVSTYTAYVTQDVPRYTSVTVTSSIYSTIRSTQVVPTTIYSTRVSTAIRTQTLTRTQIQTQVRTVTDTFTLPAQTRTRTITSTLPARTFTETDIRYSTRVEYSTIYRTQTQTQTRTSAYTITSTAVSTRIQPTTIVDYQVSTLTVASTAYITSTAPGRLTTITAPPQIRTVAPEYFTETEYVSVTVPCTQTQTGYNYDAPAKAFDFRRRN